jgi:prepilin-type N-terminal cleavage/methylation domain-containing protein
MTMRKNKGSGFTIIEVLISLTLLAIIVIGITSVFIGYQRIDRQMKMKENALFEITNIYQIFQSYPLMDDFTEALDSFYPGANDSMNHVLKCNEIYIPSENGLETIGYSIDLIEHDDFYLVSLNVTLSSLNFIDESALTRTIKIPRS